MSGNNRGRRNWTLSMTGAVLAAAAAAVIGCMAGGGEVATDRVYLTSSAGSVLFDHGKHSESQESCAVCHHELYGAEVKSCNECHDGDGLEPADFEHAELKEVHERDCSKCHDQVGEEDQVVSCRTCHPGSQEAEGRTVSCSECHDSEEFSPDLMPHDEYQEIEDHSCLGCHTPGTISEAYHNNCTTCHLAEAAEKFAYADGSVHCGACHLP